jgi:hypothetical protein
VINVVVLKLLKKGMGLPRPLGGPKTGPGMPSAHACQISLVGSSALAWFSHCVSSGRPLKELVAASCLAAVSFGYFMVEWQFRVSSRRHTRGQMVYGALLGLVLASLLRVGVVRFSSDITAMTGF